MKKHLKAFFLPVSITASFFFASYISAEEKPLLSANTIAEFAYMIDTETDTLLLSKNPDMRMYPASMTKIMTAYIAFQQLKAGLITLEDEILVSQKANRMGGSKMFIEQGKYVSVEDILKGIIIQSGNDSSIALAEFIAGDEDGFAVLMNSAAAELGMTGSNFVNASGWPNEDHYTTARDLATLSKVMIKQHPEYYDYFSEKSFTFSNITQSNRNKLLGKAGIDGIKTGYTEASGYGMVTSGQQGNRRLILVVNGLKTGAKRVSESSRLFNLGFRSTATEQYYLAGQNVTDLPLWYGQKNKIAVAAKDDVRITALSSVLKNLNQTVSFSEPIKAPIEAGDKIGQIHLHTNDAILLTVDLLAAESVAEKNYFERFNSNINYLLWGETP